MNNVLKYPGSKWNIAGKLVELMPPHHSYVEPYFGSGAVLFTKAPSAIETVNDLDGEVVNLFCCIQQDSERLARLVMTTPFSREVYDRQFEPDNSYAGRYQRAAGFLVKRWQGGLEITGKLPRTIEFFKCLDMAIAALEEIQQYREIGTVGECKEAREKQKEMAPNFEVNYGDYVSRFVFDCGKRFVVKHDRGLMSNNDAPNFCPNCGQRLDWS